MHSLTIAQVVRVTQAEGPGKRFALWLQGCPLNCPGCCNPEMIPFSGGVQISIHDLFESIQQAEQLHKIEGITIMGGEPFSQSAGLAALTSNVQQLGLSVMIFSGYTLAELRGEAAESIAEILAHTDILVDGRYESTLPDHSRRWIGSRNQQIHFLTTRYHADDACWKEPDTLEVRYVNGELSLNGFPAKQLSPLWTGRSFQTAKKQSPIGNEAHESG